MKKMDAGKIAFLVGFFGSLLLGLLAGFEVFNAGIWMTVVLVVAGIIIGFMNITTKESTGVMVSALVIGASAGILAGLPWVGMVLEAMLSSLAKVVLPAGVVVAVKTFMTKGM